MGYLIRLSGSGAEIGIGKISKAQFEFWSEQDNKEHLNSAIQGELDEDVEVPDDAHLEEHYEYQEVYCQSGIYEYDLQLEIESDDDGFDFSGDYDDVLDDLEHDGSGPVKQSSVKLPKKAGHYLVWEAEASGTLIEEEIELEDGDEFDPKKLKLLIKEITPKIKLVVGIEYDGYTLSNYSDEFEKSGDIKGTLLKS